MAEVPAERGADPIRQSYAWVVMLAPVGQWA